MYTVSLLSTSLPDRIEADDWLRDRYKRWMDNGLLSFIPPDGEFKLLDYQVAVPKGTARPIGLPLNLKAKMAIEVGGGRS